ncbi:MAG: septum formation initiator family protein [Clostridiales bacterium]|nr:septum formation initiator family protein [Clostridiales bacterium]MCD8367968.1 septum formation initiator family protein [Clostridiales bacterium]
MKTGRASLLTKLVILILFVVVAIQLLNVRGRLQTAEADYNTVQAQVTAQEAVNGALAEDIENADDPDTILSIAKEKLGLVEPGEIIFYDTTN